MSRSEKRLDGADRWLESPVSRREFLRLAAGLSLGLAFPWSAGRALASPGMRAGNPGSEAERFFFAQLRYRGGDWDPDPAAALNLSRELVRRTSVMAAEARRDVTIMSPDLFNYPFVYLTGHYEFEPFSEDEVRRLREFIDYGGLLVADDCVGHPGFDFDKSFRREMARLYPERSLEKLPREHPVFRAYYLVRTVGGRRIVSPYLEGIDLGGRTAVIYCQNDIGCALERDEVGNWVHPCLPGGERQRTQAFQLGVNIVLYALCQDYKSDKIHIPFIRQRI
jgi:hypothetical protein